MRRSLTIGLLLAAMGSTGCASRSLMQRASTLDPGESRLGAAVTGGVAHDSGNTIPVAGFDVAYRIGVADGADVGLRLFPIGARVDTKLRLYTDERVTVSVDLGLFGSGFTLDVGEGEAQDLALFLVGGNATLLVGFHVDGSELVAAAHIAPGYGSSRAQAPDGSQSIEVSGFVMESGLLLGMDLALGDVFHLMPELGVLLRFGEQRDPLSILNRDPIVLHAGIGAYFHWTL